MSVRARLPPQASALAAAPMTSAKSDHFDGARFLNPRRLSRAADVGSAANAARAADAVAETHRRSQPSGRPLLDGAAAAVTFIGHSTFLIQTAAGNILTDPMYSERAGPLNRHRAAAGSRSRRCASTTCRRFRRCSLSHNHYDHCDLRDAPQASRGDSIRSW